MSDVLLTLDEVHQLVFDALRVNGCNSENAAAVADTIRAAERDNCASHGIFRLPGYIASLLAPVDTAVNRVARLMAQLRLLSDSFHLASFRPTVVVVSHRWHCNKADLLWRKQPVKMALRRWH